MAKASSIFKEVEVKKIEKQKVGITLELSMEEARLLTFLVGKSNAFVGNQDLGTSIYSTLERECGGYDNKCKLIDNGYNLEATKYILSGAK